MRAVAMRSHTRLSRAGFRDDTLFGKGSEFLNPRSWRRFVDLRSSLP